MKPVYFSLKHVAFAMIVFKLLDSMPAAAAISGALDPKAYTLHAFLREKLDFNRRTLAQAYQQRGLRDPKWDADVMTFLEGMAQYFTYAPVSPRFQTAPIPARSELLALSAKVVKQGCGDPLVLYCRGVVLSDDGKLEDAPEMLLRAYRTPSDQYPPLRRAAIAGRRRALTLKGNADHVESEKRFFDALAEATKLPVRREDRRMILAAIDSSVTDPADAEQLYDTVSAHRSADPWLMDVLAGRHHVKLAWDARGSGWASTVTAQGWKGFFAELALARDHLVRAYTLEPTYPEPAAEMIRVTMGDEGKNESLRTWFDRAVAAQIDYYPAYDNLNYALTPKWGGSNEAQFALAVDCLDSGRWDTLIPERFIDILESINKDNNYDYEFWAQPEVHAKLTDFFDALVKHPARPDMKDWYVGWHAAVEAKLGDFPAARKLLDALGADARSQATLRGCAKIFTVPPRDLSEIYARTGPLARSLKEAAANEEMGLYGESLALYEPLLARADASDPSRAYLQARVFELQRIIPFLHSDWVNLAPDANFTNWLPKRGTWKIKGDGSISMSVDRAGNALLICPISFPGDYELDVDVELPPAANVCVGPVIEYSAVNRMYGAYVKCSNKLVLHSQDLYNELFPVNVPLSSRIHVQVVAKLLNVSVNGVPTIKDHPMIDPGDRTFVGLGAYFGRSAETAQFKNLRIRQIVK